MNKKTNKPDHLMLNKHAIDQFKILVVPATMAVETATNFSSLKNRLEKSDRYAKKMSNRLSIGGCARMS